MKLGWNPLVNELVFIYIKHDDDDDDVCLSRCLVQSTSHDGSSVIFSSYSRSGMYQQSRTGEDTTRQFAST